MVTSASGSGRGLAPDEERQVLEAVLLPAVFERRRFAAEMRLAPRRATGAPRLRRSAAAARSSSSPVRTISAWLMASVSGRRIVKREPWPGLRLHVQRAAELLDLGGDHVHADAAAGLLRDRARGREAGLEDELHGVFVG